MAQIGSAAITRQSGDLFQIAPRLRLQQPLRLAQTCHGNPLAGRHAGGLLETALKAAQTHSRPLGEHRERQIFPDISRIQSNSGLSRAFS